MHVRRSYSSAGDVTTGPQKKQCRSASNLAYVRRGSFTHDGTATMAMVWLLLARLQPSPEHLVFNKAIYSLQWIGLKVL
jgi:hypothetical protein